MFRRFISIRSQLLALVLIGAGAARAATGELGDPPAPRLASLDAAKTGGEYVLSAPPAVDLFDLEDAATTPTATIPAPTGTPNAAPRVDGEPTSGPLDRFEAAPTSATLSLHELKGVRLRPMADALRLVFLFDRPTAYTVRLDPTAQSAWLDLVNTRVGFLPQNLTRIDDPRLSGIWLTRAEGGLATLQLRFPTSEFRLEHFSITDPPVVVLDVSRADQSLARIPASAGMEVALKAPSAPSAPAAPAAHVRSGELSAALPLDWPDVPTTTALAPSVATASPSTRSVETAQIRFPASETTFNRDEVTSPSENARLLPASARDGEIRPASANYDHFPLQAVEMGSPLAQDILEAFLNRRWSLAIEHGIQYLKLNPVNNETAYVLYLMAEARWQIGAPLLDRPWPHMIDMYEQAVRRFDGGDLGAFGHWRLGFAALQLGQSEAALHHLDQSLKTTDPQLRWQAALLRAVALRNLKRYDAAIALAEDLARQTDQPDLKVQAHLQRAGAYSDQERSEDAWKAFQDALALDPKWFDLHPDYCERLARVELDTGHLQEARGHLQYLIDNFNNRPEEQVVHWGLMLAEVFARQGFEDTAEGAYAALLANDTPKGVALRDMLYRRQPDGAIEGERRFCMLLYRRGKLVKAMAEMNRSYQQSLREGIDLQPFTPVVETIVPPFMEVALATHQPYDAAQAWWVYSPMIKDRAAVLRCRLIYVDALEQLGLGRDAVNAIDLLLLEPAGPPLPSRERLLLQRGRLLVALNDHDDAIRILEPLLAQVRDPELLPQLYAQLARAYRQANRPLEAAQAFQTLATLPGVDAPLRGESVLNAGDLFLAQAMPAQSRDLGLMALFIEKQLLTEKPERLWTPSVAARLRLMLARAYDRLGEDAHAAAVLDDYLARPDLDAESRVMARLMLARCRQRLGLRKESLELYTALADDPKVPDPWRNMARQSQECLRWDLDHPDWRIERADKPGRAAGGGIAARASTSRGEP